MKALSILTLVCLTACNNNMPKPPIAAQIPKTLTIHGDSRQDPYYWLNNREDTTVISYLNAENTYREAMMADTKDLQTTLYNEMVGRIKQTDESVPYLDNGYYYYTRFEEGKEYPIFCRREGTMASPEIILLNVNELAKGHEYYQIGGLDISPDNNIMAYSVDIVSRRQYTLFFKNLATGEIYKEAIVDTDGGAAWANDNVTVFYTHNNAATLRSEKIFRHRLGTEAKDDKLVFHEKDETFNTGVGRSKSGKYIIISSGSTLSTESRILSTENSEGAFKVFQLRERDLEYSISHYKDKFYVVTNLAAKNFRLMECAETSTEKTSWKEVIAHRKDVLLEDIETFKNFLVINERKNGLAQIRIINQIDKTDHYLDFGEESYTASSSVNMDFDTEVLRYGYTSLTTPSSTYDYNMRTHAKTLLKQQEVVGGYDAKAYTTKRIYATAEDGTKIPISLVYKNTTKIDGTAPCLEYGYGSYGYSMDATFSAARLSLLDRGFVFAIAHIRGGEDMGRAWYEDGKLLKKKNTFTDFITCGKYLIAQKYAANDKLMAMGGSAGGLLMGAVANIAPELWHGIVAQVPFVDVVTTMLDESIPLTTGEYDEWGNPNDKAYYEYIKSYSPYDNVTAKAYPAMLITTGLHDSQVQYWEPAKWIARLRAMKTDNNSLYMYCNMDTGHGGASGRFEKYKEIAMEYAFLLSLVE